MSSRQEEKARRKAEREAQQRAEAQAAARRRTLRIGGIVAAAIAVIVLIAIAGISSGGGGSSTPKTSKDNGGTPTLKLGPLSALGRLAPAPPQGPNGPEGVPVPSGPALGAASSPTVGATIDGVQCLAGEQVQFHIHAHLAIFVNGIPRVVPYGIGTANPQVQSAGSSTGSGPFVVSADCFFWLHTHASDGIIHVESPVARTYTLGNFFDIWGQPLSPTQAGPARGQVVAIYNGQHYLGNPRDIPLNAHAQITLEVNRPLVAPTPITFALGL